MLILSKSICFISLSYFVTIYSTYSLTGKIIYVFVFAFPTPFSYDVARSSPSFKSSNSRLTEYRLHRIQKYYALLYRTSIFQLFLKVILGKFHVLHQFYRSKIHALPILRISAQTLLLPPPPRHRSLRQSKDEVFDSNFN